MNRILLPNTGIEISAVGFGTAGLTSAGNERAALRLLDAAFDAGITHFDTAPLYGRGQVEALVGKFLRRKRHHVTVTTKVGLYPSAFDRTFKAVLGPLRKVKHALSRRVDLGDSGQPSVRVRGEFNPKKVESSFEMSLRELQTECVDVLLLHECFVEDTLRPELIDFIGRQIERGTIRAAGIGTSLFNLDNHEDVVPDLYRVSQFANNISTGESPSDSGGRTQITHTALGPLQRLVSIASDDPARAAKATSKAGVDFTNAAAVASMLLNWARRANPDGVLLFATTNTEHLHADLGALRLPVAADEVSRFASAARSLLVPDADD